MKQSPFSSSRQHPGAGQVSAAYGYGQVEEERRPDPALDEERQEPDRGSRQSQRELHREPEARRSAGDIWQMALSELAMTMPTPTYETWVRDTSVLAYEDGEFVVGVPHAYARDWLQNRLRPQIKRTLSRLLQRSVEVTFRVRPRPLATPPQQDLPPLYRDAAENHAENYGGLEETEYLRPEGSQAPATEAERTGMNGYPTPSPARAHPTEQRPEQREAPGFQTPDRFPNGGRPADRPRRDERPADERRTARPPERTDQHAAGFYRQEDRDSYRPEMVPSGLNQLRTGMQGIALNDQYTFASFIVGSHNRLAHAAALSVSEQPGYRFNPLFIYGGVGLGKTHLLHAIGHQMLERGLRVLYCSSEQFTNELISAIRSQSTEEFRNKYRQVDLLLIDDIQFIGGKESTQEEFFHTFNHLHAGGRQVVISSDRPPKDIATLEARLRSRFEGGLQADISVPDLETRVAILQSKAQAMGARVDQEVLMLVAERVESNIRELEGALNRLIVQSPLYQDSLNPQIAEEILNDLMPQRRPREAGSVIQLVAAHFNLSVDILLGRGRTKEVAYARQIAMYLLREENSLSLPNIGELLGGRDHSTVRYGVEKVIADMEIDDTTRRHVIALREKVYSPPGSV